MEKYFIGKGAQLLTEDSEEKARIYKLELLQPEFGHMPCMKGKGVYFYTGRRRRNAVPGKSGKGGYGGWGGIVYQCRTILSSEQK